MLEITNALAPLGTSFERAGQAAWQFSEGIVEMQRRINESVQALAAMTMPVRLMVGTGPEWVACGDFETWRRGVEADTAQTRDVTHYDRRLGEGALERDETSSVHSSDSSGTGVVWSDLMATIDDLIEEA